MPLNDVKTSLTAWFTNPEIRFLTYDKERHEDRSQTQFLSDMGCCKGTNNSTFCSYLILGANNRKVSFKIGQSFTKALLSIKSIGKESNCGQKKKKKLKTAIGKNFSVKNAFLVKFSRNLLQRRVVVEDICGIKIFHKSLMREIMH